MAGAGIDTNNLAEAQKKLDQATARASQELDRQSVALERQKKIKERYASIEKATTQVKDVATKGALVGATAIAVPVKFAIDFESSMADVKKVVDFGDDPVKASQGLRQMSDEIVRLSTIYPMAAKDIASIVAAGGQSGIAKNELTTFATDAIKMGVAFDVTADQAGQAMAELRTAFGMGQREVVELADKINYLGNNTPAAAKSIMEIVQRIGPLGEVGGFASGSIAGLGATIKGMGIKEDVAATGIKNLMLALVAGDSATKAQKDAFKDLGLTSTQIAKDMQKDAEGTVIKVLEAVGKLDKHEQGSMLATLFGKESLSSIAPLLTQIDTLKHNLGLVSDATAYAGSMNAEYEARAATTANQLALLKNTLTGVAITLGSTLLPIINNALAKITPLIDKVRTWANANPELAQTLMKIGVAVVGVLGAIAVLATAVLTLIGPIALLHASIASFGGLGVLAGGVIAKLGTALMGLVSVVRAVAVFLMTNPILAFVTAIAMGAIYIWRNWATLAPYFQGLWNTITAETQALWGRIVAFWNNIKMSVINTANSLWSGLGIRFNSGITALIAIIVAFSPAGLFMRAFSAVWAYFGGLASQFRSYGANMIEGLKNGIMGELDTVLASIQNTANRIKSAFTSAMSIHSPSRVFMGYGDDIMQGLDNGLTANTSPIATMLSTADTLKGALDTSQIHFDKSQPIHTAQGLQASGRELAPISINIYPQASQSPTDIATQVANELARLGVGKPTGTALYDYAEDWG